MSEFHAGARNAEATNATWRPGIPPSNTDDRGDRTRRESA
jgi:hypothetical protein